MIRLPTPFPRAVVADVDHPRRGDLERFIAGRFAAAFDARVGIDYPLLAGLFGADGQVLAATGVRFAEAAPLFLEQYLDAPVQTALERTFGQPIARTDVVEIGSFASDDPAWSLALFGMLPAWLSGACFRRFAVATLRPELAKTLGRSGFALQTLAPADPERLAGDPTSWGRYYAGRPQVYAGRIAAGPKLPSMRDRLTERARARAARRQARAAQ